MMMLAELKLITERTHHLIDAANHTLEYSKTIIEQSKKLILGINKNRLEREAAQKRRLFFKKKAR
jgi:hypothetical protein